jgi:dTDP-4-amino-4,6-dideoxygalactose transaminase
MSNETRPHASPRIPLHRVSWNCADLSALTAALQSGLLTGDGASSRSLAALACQTLGCTAAFPVTSGTHALELMFRALPLEKEDEVICPSFTFVSVANAILLAGGTPVFADVDSLTLNLDPDSVAERLTSRTRGVVPAHYAGIAANMERLDALASTKGLSLLEDAAHALGARYLGRPLGTWGRAGAFSFHGTKNVVAGEGGLLVTSDTDLADRAEIVREKGTDRRRFLRGEVDKYTWQEVGSSYLMSDLLAALVLFQWQRLAEINDARRKRFERYMQALEPLAHERLVTLPGVPVACEPAFHIFYLRVADELTRQRLQANLRERGIEASPHFVPLHLSPLARQRLHTRAGDLPVTERAADTLIRLPLYPTLDSAEQDEVIDAVFAFFGRRPC